MGRMMELGPINRDAYAAFILRWFEKGFCRVERRDLEHVFEIGVDVPYNIQRICHILWEKARGEKEIHLPMIEETPYIIAQQDAPHFESLWSATSQPQKTLLVALAGETDPKPFSKAFQLTHGIGPSSSIKASLDSLTKKGILYRTKKGAYRFPDKFMMFWILALSTDRGKTS